MPMPKFAKKDVTVIGAGIVGLAVAFHLVGNGREVTVIDRDPDGDKASYGNAGGIAVTEVIPASVPGLALKVPRWLLDPLGPLSVRPLHAVRLVPWLLRFARAGTPAEVRRISAALAAINGRVYNDLLPMLDRTGLTAELHRKGALTVYERHEALEAEKADWDLKRSHGIDVTFMDGEEARRMEPALSPAIRAAAFTPQWSHVSNPKRIVARLKEWLTEAGVAFIEEEVRTVTPREDTVSLGLGNGSTVETKQTVVAAGAWSGAIARQIGDKVFLESERGYNTTIADPGVTLTREIIFAEKKFVATPLSCGLRIGGAAEFGGLDAVANYRRSEALARLASHYLPGLKTLDGAAWAGHRPATPDSLPVIGPSPRSRNVHYAFGHGHLGLTQAATTGRLVADLIENVSPPINVSAYSIARFN